MFRTLICPSSGGQIVLSQHLVSSLSVQPFTESDDTRFCDNTICPPEDGHVDARNMSVQPFTESDDTSCYDNTISPPEDGHVNVRSMSRIVV